MVALAKLKALSGLYELVVVMGPPVAVGLAACFVLAFVWCLVRQGVRR